MKIITFLSKFTLICNIAFVFFIIFSKIESMQPPGSEAGGVAQIPFLKELVIILGFSAIVINLLMCFTYAILVVMGKERLLPKWIAVINLCFLILEFYFHFL